MSLFFTEQTKKIFLHPFIHKYRDYIGIFRFFPPCLFVLFDNLYNNKFKKMMIEHHPNHYYHHHHPDDEVGNLSIFLFFLGPYVLFKHACARCARTIFHFFGQPKNLISLQKGKTYFFFLSLFSSNFWNDHKGNILYGQQHWKILFFAMP